MPSLADIAPSVPRPAPRSLNPVDVAKSVENVVRPNNSIPTPGRGVRPEDLVRRDLKLNPTVFITQMRVAETDFDIVEPHIRKGLEKAWQWIIETVQNVAPERILLPFTDPPFIRVVNPNGYTSDPVYYVNGVWTKVADARKSAADLSEHLKRPIHLLHNRTSLEGFTGSVTSPSLTDEDRAGDWIEAFQDRTWMMPIPQANACTRQLAHLLYFADRRISIVTHSQGCIIMRNALYTVGFFRQAEWLRNSVRWVAAAAVINDNEVWPQPNKVTTLRNSGDFLADLVGLTNGRAINPLTIPAHFFENYIPQINDSMLWPTTTTNLGLQQKYDQREIIVDNQSDETIAFKFQYETKSSSGASVWLPTGEYYSLSVPGDTSAYLTVNNNRIRARRLLIWGESNSGQTWSQYRDTAIDLVPDGSYVTTGSIGSHRAVFKTREPSRDTTMTPFCEVRFDQNHSPLIREAKWLQVSEKGAMQIDERGNLQIFRKSEANPPDAGPFGTINNLLASCYVFSRVSPANSFPELVMLPRDGVGAVRQFSFDPDGYRWTTLGEVDQYNTLKRTNWNSRYTTVNGQWVSARITFQGANGRYELQNTAVAGQFNDIDYYEDSAVFFIQGKWSLQAAVGWFRFDQDDENRDAFTGIWGFGQPFGTGGQQGVWNGQRILVTVHGFRA